MGIPPIRPETGFGYLRQGEKVGTNIFKLAEFVEKPDRETAQGYLSKEGWYWNSGIFLFPNKVFLEEVETYQEEMFKHCQLAHQRSQLDGEFIRLSKVDFPEPLLPRMATVSPFSTLRSAPFKIW